MDAGLSTRWITWSATEGRRYLVQFKRTPRDADCTKAGLTIAATGSTAWFIDDVADDTCGSAASGCCRSNRLCSPAGMAFERPQPCL